MNFSETYLREVFSHNLAEYRKQSGMTQLELAEKLNYSDKSISKWERGDGLPDLPVAAKLADLFGITLNDLVCEHQFKKPLLSRNKILTTLLSIGVVWFAAAIAYFVLQLIIPSFNSEIMFLYAVPASCIVAFIFTNLWWNKIWQFASVSALIWTLCVSIVASIPAPRVGLIFIIAGVLQVLIVLWYLMKR